MSTPNSKHLPGDTHLRSEVDMDFASGYICGGDQIVDFFLYLMVIQTMQYNGVVLFNC